MARGVSISNKTARILGTCKGHQLLPGKNDFSHVDDKMMRQVIENDQFRSWQKLGWVAVSGLPGTRQEDLPKEVPQEILQEVHQEGPQDDDPTLALRGESMDVAKSMIAACSDIELLMLWYENDKRKGVKSAIEARLQAIDDTGEEE